MSGMGLLPDLIRLGLRAKYQRTHKWTKTDHVISTFMPRSPMSAAMWGARVAYEHNKQSSNAPRNTREFVTNGKRIPSILHQELSERDRQMAGLGIDESSLDSEDSGFKL